MIEKDTRRQKGRPPGLTVWRAKKRKFPFRRVAIAPTLAGLRSAVRLESTQLEACRNRGLYL